MLETGLSCTLCCPCKVVYPLFKTSHPIFHCIQGHSLSWGVFTITYMHTLADGLNFLNQLRVVRTDLPCRCQMQLVHSLLSCHLRVQSAQLWRKGNKTASLGDWQLTSGLCLPP